jgi:hypothetical protein
MSKRWTLDQAIEQGHLMAFIAQEAERGITSANAAIVYQALEALEHRAKGGSPAETSRNS